MDNQRRELSLRDLQSRNRLLTFAAIAQAAAIAGLVGLNMSKDQIIVQQVPGLLEKSVYEKNKIDKPSQIAILKAVTSAVASINPANIEQQKIFLQSFLSPTAYTRITKELDARIQKMIAERETGSTYFVFKDYEYDAKLNKHFVLGDFHIVNAAKDTSEPYVWEFDAGVNNYKFEVESMVVYPGNKTRNSNWVDLQSGEKK